MLSLQDQWRKLDAELAALKAQEPVGWYTEDHLDDKSATTYSKELADRWVAKGWPVFPLYAAPVSEAKAQGVVMPEQDGSDAQIAFWAGFEFAVCGLHNGNIRAAWNDFKGSEQFKRLNAAPVQHVSVPDASTDFSQFLSAVMDAAGLVRHGRRSKELSEYLGSKCMEYRCFAAPAAPAADAGLVAVEWAKDAEEWGPALNEAGWLFLSELNEDPQKSALIFNNCKGPLRAAIMKYAEIVTAHCAKGVV